MFVSPAVSLWKKGTKCNGRIYSPTWIYCKKTALFEGISNLFTPSGLWGFNWNSNKKNWDSKNFYSLKFSVIVLPSCKLYEPKSFHPPSRGRLMWTCFIPMRILNVLSLEWIRLRVVPPNDCVVISSLKWTWLSYTASPDFHRDYLPMPQQK